jgi:hypothetical protein
VKQPTYEALVHAQQDAARERAKDTSLEALWNMGDTWTAGSTAE